MASKRQDVRITKTQRALAYAMLSLLEKNGFARITVNDICQEALVSRSTFYAHFEDKYQLLLFCMQALREQLAARTDAAAPYDFLLGTLKGIQEHAQVYRNIFLADPSRELLRMFQGHFAKVLEKVLPEHRDADESIPSGIATEMLSAYFTGGIGTLLMWWIERNFPISAEKMAACQWQLLQAALAR